MTEYEAAGYLRCCLRTIQRWRKDGCIIGRNGQIDAAPPYYKYGGRIRYKRGQLIEQVDVVRTQPKSRQRHEHENVANAGGKT